LEREFKFFNVLEGACARCVHREIQKNLITANLSSQFERDGDLGLDAIEFDESRAVTSVREADLIAVVSGKTISASDQC
jgi:hypothetical protein